MPFAHLTPACVLADAPITWNLFKLINTDLIHLKLALSSASGQTLNTKSWTAYGDMLVTGDWTLGANAYGVAQLVQPVAGLLAIVFKGKVWNDGYEVNASGDQFAPAFGDIVWGEFMALTHALGLMRGGPFLLPNKEES